MDPSSNNNPALQAFKQQYHNLPPNKQPGFLTGVCVIKCQGKDEQSCINPCIQELKQKLNH